MANIAVALQNVWKRFPGPAGETVVAVKDISLRINDGEFFALLGPSGCGKTTTLRMIAGFELPTEGEIYIHGRAMGKTPPYQRPVNTVFQSYALFPHMTIGENVAFGLEMKKVSRTEAQKRATEALRWCGRRAMSGANPSSFPAASSSAALARALVNWPEVLLDEPPGRADLKLRKEMQIELKKPQRGHHLRLCDTRPGRGADHERPHCGHVARCGAGRRRQRYLRAPTASLYDFIGDTNFLDGKIVEKDGNKVRGT